MLLSRVEVDYAPEEPRFFEDGQPVTYKTFS